MGAERALGCTVQSFRAALPHARAWRVQGALKQSGKRRLRLTAALPASVAGNDLQKQLPYLHNAALFIPGALNLTGVRVLHRTISRNGGNSWK